MKTFAIAVLSAVALIACSTETESQSASQEVATPEAETVEVKKSGGGLFGGKEEEFVKIIQDGFETQMLLYTRSDPRVAEAMKPVTFSKADTDRLRCAYREMKKAGMSEQIEMSIRANAELRRIILDNPEVSLKNIDQYTEVIDAMDAQGKLGTDADRDKINAINSECKVISLMMEKMQESGLQEAMMSLDGDL